MSCLIEWTIAQQAEGASRSFANMLSVHVVFRDFHCSYPESMLLGNPRRSQITSLFKVDMGNPG